MSRHFRAKVFRKNRRTGEYLDCGWVYGDLHHEYNGSLFTLISNIDDEKIETRTYNVESTTVGQYVGIDDVNHKNIYEGDVIKMTKKDKAWHSVNEFTGVVEFDNALQYIVTHKSDWIDLANPEYQIEVVGNIHDNQEWKKVRKPVESANPDTLPF